MFLHWFCSTRLACATNSAKGEYGPIDASAFGEDSPLLA